MAVDTRPPSYTAPAPRGLDRLSDEQLIARFRAGDDAALDVALRRHERRLLRFARRILGTRSPNAEDVVQEAMLRTHLVLRRGDRAIDLGPWLFKLVRNCALDELARVRSEVGPLDAVPEPAAVGSDPADVTAARGRMRDTLADVAALPDLQRHALLRREIEGATHADVAGELGITEPASRLLVLRARANLVKARAGRDARCDDIRDELLLADDAGRRASAHAYRHLATCAACREFRSALRQRRHDLKVLTPLPLLFGGLVGLKLAGGALLPGAGAGGSSVGAKLATAGAVTAAVAGGTLGIDRVFGPGDPAPVTVRSVAVPGGLLASGSPLPVGTAIVTRTVAPDPALPVSRYAIACPPGLRVAGLAPTTSGSTHALAPETIVGASTKAVVLAEPSSARAHLELAVVCRDPAADGSVLADPVRARAAASSSASTATVCVPRTYLRRAPGSRAVTGSLTRRQPVAVRAEREGWRKVTADTGATGWVRTSALC